MDYLTRCFLALTIFIPLLCRASESNLAWQQALVYSTPGEREPCSKFEQCTKHERHTRAPKYNLWNSLTADEIEGIIKWLYDETRGLNLTKYEDAGPWDNTIGVVEALSPNKTHALSYLDEQGPRPAKYARVLLYMSAVDPPYTEEFMVSEQGLNRKKEEKSNRM